MTGTDIDRDGVRRHVELDGPEGAPPVLVLHGITSCTATWDWLVPLLSGTHRVARLDFRGHGGSDRTPGEYHSQGYVSDAVAVCEALFDRPCTVIGHSLGGITALGLAQSRPDLVEALVLEDPPMGATRDPLEGGNSLLDAFRMIREMVPQLQASGIDATTLTGVLAQAPGPTGEPMGERLHGDAVGAMAAALLQLDATVLDPLFSGALGEWVYDVDRPVVQRGVLVAADPASPDCVCRPDDIARAQAGGLALDVRVPAGSGHLIHDSLAHRDAMAQAVRDVLGR
ncbi:MAG: alpha/beta hydrolase [Acidimicrobiales bacterium]